jgi:alpha-beta hydrolase superfamily lysophospholipase
LSERFTLVRYDERGCGLSDWAVLDFSFEAWVQDLETVIDTVQLDRFALLGISQGAGVAMGSRRAGGRSRTIEPCQGKRDRPTTPIPQRI